MKKRQYMAPQLTVVEFKAERGYLASNLMLTSHQENYNEQSQENWNDGGSLFDSW